MQAAGTYPSYLACLAVRAHNFGADNVRHSAAHFGIVNTYSSEPRADRSGEPSMRKILTSIGARAA